MQLVIMRHGEAQTYAASDAQRELTERGQSQAIAAGKCLSESGFMPDQVWVSPYVRAQQTCSGVLESFSGLKPQINDALIPESYANLVIESLSRQNVENLLIVSHQPLVSTLVALLVDAKLHQPPPMSPATMALLSADDFLSGCCTLEWLRHAPDFETCQ